MTYVGFVGYSSVDFDKEKAIKIIDEIFYNLNADDIIVSGATNMGIPKLVYEEARRLNMKTIGVMPKEGKDYDVFPVDELIIVGEKFGDESIEFLSSIEVLYKIGGGAQSISEFKKAKDLKIEVYEYEI